MAQSQQLVNGRQKKDIIGWKNEETFYKVAKYVVQLTSVTVQMQIVFLLNTWKKRLENRILAVFLG